MTIFIVHLFIRRQYNIPIYIPKITFATLVRDMLVYLNSLKVDLRSTSARALRFLIAKLWMRLKLSLNLYLQWIAHLVMSTCTRKCMLLGSISAYFWTYGKTYYLFLDIRKDICSQSWTYGKTLFWTYGKTLCWTYGKTNFLILKNMFLLEKNFF